MKKIIVKFGCFFDEEDMDEIFDEEETEDLLLPHKEFEKEIKSRKEEILAVLKKDSSVTAIEPLECDTEIKRLFSDSYFGEPIKFKIKIPFKPQEISQTGFYFNDEIYETIEEFNIIFDGTLFAIYQEVKPEKLDFIGGPDVREKIYKIFKEIFPKLRTVPPTPFRENFIYLVSYPNDKIAIEKKKHKGDFVFPLEESDFEKKIYEVFESFERYLHSIYSTYYLNEKINTIALNIIKTQKKLNPLYNDIVNSRFLDFNIDKKKSIKLLIQQLCALNLDYVLAVNEFEVELSRTISLIKRSPFEDYETNLKSETSDYIKMDVDSLYKYIENITNELNTRSINFSTMTAGIIGGLIGAAGAFIATIR